MARYLSPWMTRNEAAAWLRVSTATLDRHLVLFKDHPNPVQGKIRCGCSALGNAKIKRVLVLRADVYAQAPDISGLERTDEEPEM